MRESWGGAGAPVQPCRDFDHFSFLLNKFGKKITNLLILFVLAIHSAYFSSTSFFPVLVSPSCLNTYQVPCTSSSDLKDFAPSRFFSAVFFQPSVVGYTRTT